MCIRAVVKRKLPRWHERRSQRATIAGRIAACPKGGQHNFQMAIVKVGNSSDQFGFIQYTKCGTQFGMENLLAILCGSRSPETASYAAPNIDSDKDRSAAMFATALNLSSWCGMLMMRCDLRACNVRITAARERRVVRKAAQPGRLWDSDTNANADLVPQVGVFVLEALTCWPRGDSCYALDMTIRFSVCASMQIPRQSGARKA